MVTPAALRLGWSVPYRVDFSAAGDDALDRLIELGALDVEALPGSGLAALMPDRVSPQQLADALGAPPTAISPALGRDDGSVWVLRPRPIRVGGVRLVPPDSSPALPGDLTLIDGSAFGTGLHPTTALCLEALEDIVGSARPKALLDVGTGSGVLALAALRLDVPAATGIDIDADALDVAAQNAALNDLTRRLTLGRGGPEAVAGLWPLIFANVLAAPLIEMAPALVQRLEHQGQLVLSGIATSLESEVVATYRRLGMRHLRTDSRGGWVAVLLQASW